MRKSKIIASGILSVGLIFTAVNALLCYDDGFGSARKIESRHFDIYYAPELKPQELAQQLNIGPSDIVLAGKSSGINFSFNSGLGDALDMLFIRVRDILDMPLYAFKGEIKICRDKEQLDRAYNNLFRQRLNAHSFYAQDINTIYVSADNFQRPIVAHEMAHAVIGNYFAVHAPERVAEILAGYVEYQLRKSADK